MHSRPPDDAVETLIASLGGSFRLDARVSGRPLGELLARTVREAAASEPVIFGTPGDAGELHSTSQGPTHFFYRPHLFPGMDPSLRLGHMVQVHLLPRELPPDSPVEAAAMLESYCHLSGDLFGWQATGDGGLTLWLLDVSGHGIRAGFAAVVLKLLLAEIDTGQGLSELAVELERRFLAIRHPDDRACLYATGVLLRIAGDGSVTYLSAGHPPMLVRRAGGSIERLGATTTPLALLPELDAEEMSSELLPGDSLLAYSDGLLELARSDGEAFGLDRTEAVLSGGDGRPTRVLADLAGTIAAFHDLSRLDDDLSFIALRRRDRE